MALIVRRAGSEDIPEGAVKLNEDQAIRYQMRLIEKWPKFSEVYAIRAGPGILGAVAATSAFIINNHFRYKLKLGKYGRMSSYLSVVAIPTMFSALFHSTFVQSHIILKLYDCPLCLQTRGALLQAGAGAVYPFLLAPIGAFMFATRHFTYRLPSVTTHSKDIIKLWVKFTKSGSTMASVLLAVNLLAGMYITAKGMKQHINISLQLEEYERKLEDGVPPEDLEDYIKA